MYKKACKVVVLLIKTIAFFRRSRFRRVVESLRACLHGGGRPQVGEVTRLGEVKK